MHSKKSIHFKKNLAPSQKKGWGSKAYFFPKTLKGLSFFFLKQGFLIFERKPFAPCFLRTWLEGKAGFTGGLGFGIETGVGFFAGFAANGLLAKPFPFLERKTRNAKTSATITARIIETAAKSMKSSEKPPKPETGVEGRRGNKLVYHSILNHCISLLQGEVFLQSIHDLPFLVLVLCEGK